MDAAFPFPQTQTVPFFQMHLNFDSRLIISLLKANPWDLNRLSCYGRSRVFKLEDWEVTPDSASQRTSDCAVVVQLSPEVHAHVVELLGSAGAHRQ